MTDCLHVDFVRHLDRPAVRGQVVAMSWTSTPCPEPRSFACALSGGGTEEAVLTVAVHERWGDGGRPVAPAPAFLHLVGPRPHHTAECGDAAIAQGSERVFVLDGAIAGGFRYVDSFAPEALGREAEPTVHKRSTCAGCASGDAGGGVALVALVLFCAVYSRRWRKPRDRDGDRTRRVAAAR